MKEKIQQYSTKEETFKLNSLLGLNKETYTIGDLLNYLPEKVRTKRGVGYLRISPIDIIYSSLDQEIKQSVLLMRQFLTSDRTIYTAAIEILEDIQKYGEKD